MGQGMVIPIYNNNPRAAMRDNVVRPRTTYSTRNAGGGDGGAEQPRVGVWGKGHLLKYTPDRCGHS